MCIVTVLFIILIVFGNFRGYPFQLLGGPFHYKVFSRASVMVRAVSCVYGLLLEAYMGLTTYRRFLIFSFIGTAVYASQHQIFMKKSNKKYFKPKK